ncbi:MAG: AAA family ATPase, partial [Verrucomicrobiaceae bacterium]
ASREIYQQAQQRGVKLVTWEDFRRSHLSNGTGDESTEELPLAAQAPLPLMEEKEGQLRFMDLWMAKPKPHEGAWQGLIPSADRFKHLVFDQPTADTIRAVALGAAHDYPQASEGETSATKTTAVSYLAHVLKRPLLRMNLHGQTDSGELIARYVPGSVGDGISMGQLQALAPRLSKVSRDILAEAEASQHGLTSLEKQLIMGNERLPASNWQLQLGALPKALENGHWLLLDEINLAEPQNLECLNSVLEHPRMLVLSEGDGRVYGPGGDIPVHPDFRIFATLNPAEYSGRNVLSPAFRDRWTIWHHAAKAGEADYLAMIRFLATGHHPVVHCRGKAYQAASTEPLFEHLQLLPDWETLARHLALFQISMVKASGTEGGPASLGRTRRERYSFTRRTLLSTLEFVHRQLVAGMEPSRALLREAIEIFYIKRLSDVADRNAVAAMLRAADL